MNRPPRTERFPRTPRSSHRPHNRHHHRPSLEALETLCLMSADLTVTNIATTGNTALAQGQAVSLNYTIKNQGSTTAVQANTYDDLFLSTKPTFDNSAQRLTYGDGRGRDAFPLAPGASYTRSYSYGPPRGTTPGTYYLYVIADTGGNLDESDETNNVSPAVSFTYIPLPDLTVTNIATTGNTALAQGQAVSLNYTIKNQGSTTAVQANTYDDLFLSTKPTFDNSAQRLTYGDGRGRDAFPLAPGASYTRSYSYGPPRGTTPGTYYLYVIADTGGNLDESDETNNVSPAVSFTYIPLPDLTVTNIATTGNTALAQGQAVSLNYTIKNQGSTTAVQANTYDDLFLSTKPTFDNSAQRLTYGDGRGRDAFPLAPGASYTRSYSYGPPRGTTPGTYYLYVIADTGGNLDESDETNNVSPAVSFTYIPLPDLTVTNISGPAGPIVPGVPFTLNYTITNQGTTTAIQTNAYDDFFFSTKPNFDNSAQRITYGDGRGRDAFPLAPGASYTRSFNYTLPNGSAPGTYYLYVVADTGNNLDESDETNNVSAPFAINPNAPDLTVTSFTGPATAVAGEAFSLSWMVKNQGDIATTSASISDQLYYSTKATFDASAVAFGSAYPRPNAATPLGFGASYSQTVAATLPGTPAPGVYYLYVKTDSTNSQGEFNEANNVSAPLTVSTDKPDLVVTSLTGPTAPIVPGEVLNLAWTVKNQGTVAAAASFIEDQLYYSTSATFDSSAVPLGTAYPRPNGGTPLAGGASYTQTAAVALPGSLAVGTYYLYVRTDNRDFQPESDEGNNTSAPLTLTANKPDLIVTALTGPTATVVPGESIAFGWTVQNQGTIAANSSLIVDQLYYSTKATFDSTAVAFGPATLRPDSGTPVAAGASYNQTLTTALPGGLAAGTYYIYVKTDNGNSQVETNETNNVSAATAIKVDKPDLIVTSLVGPTTTVVPGSDFNISWTVKNQGTIATTSTTIADRLYYSTKSTFDSTAVAFGPSTLRPNPTTPLTPGASYTQAITTALPSSLGAGAYYLFLRTDNGDSQVETNETNNVSGSFLINPNRPNLTLTAASATPTAIIPGQTTKVAWTVKNIGSFAADGAWTDAIYLSTDATLDATDILLQGGIARPGALGVGASYDQSASVTLSSLADYGKYYLLIATDATDNQAETDETDNIAAVAISLVDSGVVRVIRVTPAGGIQTTKSGGSTSFTVVLTNRPDTDVVVPIRSSDPTQGTVATTSLTFTRANWATPQTVTIQGVNDGLAGDSTFQVILGPTTSGDARYNGLTPPAVTLTNVDDIVRNPAPTITGFAVNDGASQRSKVNSLTLRFNSVVTLGAGAITVVNSTDGTSVNLIASPTTENGQTVVTLTFTGDGVVGGSLADGRYTLTVNPAQVTDGGGRHLAGGYSAGFFRLFGDTDGNAVVDNADAFAFRPAFNTTQGSAAYLWYLDFNGDGTIDRATDSAELTKRNRKRV